MMMVIPYNFSTSVSSGIPPIAIARAAHPARKNPGAAARRDGCLPAAVPANRLAGAVAAVGALRVHEACGLPGQRRWHRSFSCRHTGFT
eukprot:5202805-Pleurochrysis_carterae.AAC.4